MSEVFFIGDTHFGHKTILKFRKMVPLYVTTVEEHDEWLVNNWNSVVTKRDKVFVTGDFAFGQKNLSIAKRLNGHKVLVKGNHDKFHYKSYEGLFHDIIGVMSYKGKFWVSHFPVHPSELRGRYNIHGHVHANTLDDERYFNTSVENINGTPINFEEIKARLNV